VTDWTVRIARAVDVDSWAEDKPIESISALHDWLAGCQEAGPPADAWLVELEVGYRFRYWLIEENITVEFIADSYERWMLVTKLD